MTQPWTRGDILDLHILILLVIWLLLDRNNIYFDQFLKKAWGYVCDLWQLAMLFKE